MVAVPIYNFHCKECKKSFTLTMALAEYERGKFVCPKCKSKKVEQQMAAFFAVTAKKS
jgi:putative FmdB family regulatory protein